MKNMILEYWPVERLRPCATPLRKNDGCVDRMAEAIAAFGFRVPVLALPDGEILDGHLRLKAAMRLGMSEIPVLPAEGMSSDEVRAFRLLVNRSANWAQWSAEAVSVELAALSGSDFDLTLTGFDSREIDAFLRMATRLDADTVDDAPEAPAVPVTIPGDVWLMGAHRLICTDATVAANYARLLPDGERADMIWTDPPYNVAYEGRAGKIRNDAMSEKDFALFLASAFGSMVTALRPGGAVYVAHADGCSGLAFRRAFAESGLKLASCLVWLKNQPTLTRSDYHWQHEPILYGWLPGAAHSWCGDRKQSTVQRAFPAAVRVSDDEGRPCWQIMDGEHVWRIGGNDLRVEELSGTVFCEPKPRASALHPTMKPVGLIVRMLENSSRRGDVVLDPFGGSGSTLMACESTGRCCRTMELDPHFADVIVRRWQDATGGTALLEGEVLPFDEVAVQRGAA